MTPPDPCAARRRSVLFAPGSRPERFAKAVASGADVVCLDLEDGVASDAKEAARAHVASWLASRAEGDAGRGAGVAPEILVRINDPTSEAGRLDLEALARVHPPDGLMVPKVDGPEVLTTLLGVLGGEGTPALFPLVETARGLQRVEELAAASLPVAALVFGGMDMAVELGARFAWEPLLYARSRLVHAAALGGVGAIDVPWADLKDTAGLEEEARRGAALGFTGKLAIHPAHVPHIHRGIEPEPDELERARRILTAALRSSEGVQVVDGKMVDRPIVEAAKRVLARAGLDWAAPDRPGPA
jgi:citrate lyase beta subunit